MLNARDGWVKAYLSKALLGGGGVRNLFEGWPPIAGWTDRGKSEGVHEGGVFRRKWGRCLMGFSCWRGVFRRGMNGGSVFCVLCRVDGWNGLIWRGCFRF